MAAETFQERFDKMTSPVAVYEIQVRESQYEIPERVLLREILEDAIFTVQKGTWLHRQGRKFPRVNAQYTESDFTSADAWIRSEDTGFSICGGWTFREVCDILNVNHVYARRSAYEIDRLPEEIFTMRKDLVRERRKSNG